MVSDRDYWAARALQRENEAYLSGVNLTGKMFLEYDQAAKEIRLAINDFYSKYAGKYGLTYDQAVRLLSRSEFREWKATLGEYVERIAQEPDPHVKALLTAQLDALSTNSQISRLESLMGQIDLKLNDLFEQGVTLMKEEFGDSFTEGYYKKVYDIQSRTGFFNEIAALDESVVEDALSYGAMFNKVFQTITVDNGSEFANCAGMERSCLHPGEKRTKVYYCHPYSSYERGTNENINTMIRRWFPKGTDFGRVTVAAIQKVEDWINNYPREIFGFYSAETVFTACLESLT